MPIRTKVDTKGFEEYLEELNALGDDIDDACDEALPAGGDVLVDGMRQRVAKDTHNLEQHIEKSEPKRDGNFHFILVGLIHPDANTARYGTAQEYGTSSMAAHPYIRPTIDEDMRTARAEMRTAFKARIEQRRGA